MDSHLPTPDLIYFLIAIKYRICSKCNVFQMRFCRVPGASDMLRGLLVSVLLTFCRISRDYYSSKLNPKKVELFFTMGSGKSTLEM